MFFKSLIVLYFCGSAYASVFSSENDYISALPSGHPSENELFPAKSSGLSNDPPSILFGPEPPFPPAHRPPLNNQYLPPLITEDIYKPSSTTQPPFHTTPRRPTNTYPPPHTTPSRPTNTYPPPHTTPTRPKNTYPPPHTTPSRTTNTYPPAHTTPTRPTNAYPPTEVTPVGDNSNKIERPHEDDHHHHHHHHVHMPGMPFRFSYTVKDDYFKNDYSHNAISDGDVTKGEYRVLLPDGRTQIVEYTADWKNGYRAHVSYSGQPNHNAQSSFSQPQQTIYGQR